MQLHSKTKQMSNSGKRQLPQLDRDLGRFKI